MVLNCLLSFDVCDLPYPASRQGSIQIGHFVVLRHDSDAHASQGDLCDMVSHPTL